MDEAATGVVSEDYEEEEMRLIDADALTNDILRRWNTNDDTDFANKEVWKALEEAPTIDVPQWIPCEERLPEEYGLYLATMNDGFVQECSYVPTDYGDILLTGWNTCEAFGFKVLNETDVLAWMQLPKPYAERKDHE